MSAMDLETVKPTQAQVKARRSRSLAIAITLVIFVIVVYATSIAKLGAALMSRPL